MSWDVEYTEQFETWWVTLAADDQRSLLAVVLMLEIKGPGLGRPHADRVHASRHHNMKELRDQSLRVLFIFDPRRTAILLLGGDKSPDDPTTPTWNDWYEMFVPLADLLYDDYLDELRREGLI
jgi:hypothetical protein